jgi:hypothetical protein
MRRFVLKRRVGRAAAFVAAYALVLNVILSSLLVASMSPAAAAAGEILCVNSVGTDTAHGDADNSGRGNTIHCPLCLGHHVTGALPPPAFTLGARSPISIATIRAFETRLVVRFQAYDHQSRAPPASI